MEAKLLNIFGDDLMVVNAARVSYGKIKEKLDENDIKLLRFLMKSGHTSPFRHPQIQFRVHCPIFVERQLFKHQVGLTANSISGRYVDFSDEYWIPNKLRKQSTDSKQGSEGFVENPDLNQKIKNHLKASENLYAELSNQGVAKEQARIICPVALYTTFIWTGSLWAYLYLFSLRLKKDAQKETRDLVYQMFISLKDHPDKPFENSINAWLDYQFNAQTLSRLDLEFLNYIINTYISQSQPAISFSLAKAKYEQFKDDEHIKIGMNTREFNEFWAKIDHKAEDNFKLDWNNLYEKNQVGTQ